MGKKPFSITTEDYKNAPNGFSDNMTCPLVQAFKRQFPQYKDSDILVGHFSINLCGDGKIVAEIHPAFYIEDYRKLANGEEFHTEIEF